jgi:hypothetical protein
MNAEQGNNRALIASYVQKGRILGMAYLSTVAVMAIVVPFALGQDSKPPVERNQISLVFGIMTLPLLLASEFVPAFIAKGSKTEDVKAGLAATLTQFIIASAFRESIAVLALVNYLISPEARTLSYAMWAVSAAMMVIRFPSERSVTRGIPAEYLR